MTKEIAIVENNIDWLGIIDMAFKRIGWGKIHTLYVCDDVSITCTMDEFNFSSNKASFIIKCNYPEDGLHFSYDNYSFLYYHLDNFTVDNFKTLMLKKINMILNSIVLSRTERNAKSLYFESKVSSSDIDEELITKYDMEDDHKKITEIANEEIRDISIDAFNDSLLELANEEYNQLVDAYESSNRDSTENIDLLIEKITDLLEKHGESQ